MVQDFIGLRHSYDDINNKVTDLYDDFYAETKGLVIDTNSLDIQDSRADKMVNYNFKAIAGQSIIPLT